MIATIPLATGNKLNCFISARGMLAVVWHCVLLFFLCVFFVNFYMLINHLLNKKKCRLMNLPFSACLATNKGHLHAKIDP